MTSSYETPRDVAARARFAMVDREDVFEPIHQLRRVQKAATGSSRTVGARCGYEATCRSNESMPDEFSAWALDVTCPACLSGPSVGAEVS